MQVEAARTLTESEAELLDCRLRAAAAEANSQLRPPKLRTLLRTFCQLLRKAER